MMTIWYLEYKSSLTHSYHLTLYASADFVSSITGCWPTMPTNHLYLFTGGQLIYCQLYSAEMVYYSQVPNSNYFKMWSKLSTFSLTNKTVRIWPLPLVMTEVNISVTWHVNLSYICSDNHHFNILDLLQNKTEIQKFKSIILVKYWYMHVYWTYLYKRKSHWQTLSKQILASVTAGACID